MYMKENTCAMEATERHTQSCDTSDALIRIKEEDMVAHDDSCVSPFGTRKYSYKEMDCCSPVWGDVDEVETKPVISSVQCQNIEKIRVEVGLSQDFDGKLGRAPATPLFPHINKGTCRLVGDDGQRKPVSHLDSNDGSCGYDCASADAQASDLGLETKDFRTSPSAKEEIRVVERSSRLEKPDSSSSEVKRTKERRVGRLSKEGSPLLGHCDESSEISTTGNCKQHSTGADVISSESMRSSFVLGLVEEEVILGISSEAVSQKKRYMCEICNNTFTQRSSLNTHMLIHKNIRPYKCDICKKSFLTSSHRNKHMLIHNNVRPYKCDLCERSFTIKGDLNKHLLIHSGIRPFQCELCDKAYTQERHLSAHMLVHNNIRAFQCDVCDKSFVRKGDYKRHTLIHDNIYPFQCELCSKCFADRSHLRTHLSVHYNLRPFSCGLCDKTFTQKCYLNAHMLLHNNIDALKCDICKKTFAHPNNLKRHVLIHSNTRPFTCNICDASFTQKGNLTRHIATHKQTVPSEDS